jgi:hypothetical protein
LLTLCDVQTLKKLHSFIFIDVLGNRDFSDPNYVPEVKNEIDLMDDEEVDKFKEIILKIFEGAK